MTRIAFFGHDAGDAAIRRRVVAFQGAGYDVTGLMMRRGDDRPRLWENIDLGQTFDGAYIQRLKAILNGVKVAQTHVEMLRRTDVFYARNLDMLLCASTVRDKLNLDVPLVYECLDIHHKLSGNGLTSIALRKMEGGLLAKSSLLVYSSPAFEQEYFSKYFPDQYTPYLLENRFAFEDEIAARPDVSKTPNKPLRLGWFGVLRCHRTLELLETLALAMPAQVEIVIHGMPAETQIPDFHQRIAAHPNMSFGGKYRAPQDLQKLYESVDLVWAGDFYQAGFNSKWLLPNRLYEGGYFGVPAIAPMMSETGKWIDTHEAGFTLAEPLERALPALLASLVQDPARILQKSKNLRNLPLSTFVQPQEAVTALIEKALHPTSNRSAA